MRAEKTPSCCMLRYASMPSSTSATFCGFKSHKGWCNGTQVQEKKYCTDLQVVALDVYGCNDCSLGTSCSSTAFGKPDSLECDSGEDRAGGVCRVSCQKEQDAPKFRASCNAFRVRLHCLLLQYFCIAYAASLHCRTFFPRILLL